MIHQRRTKRFVGTGKQKLVAAACFGSAGRNASGKRRDDSGCCFTGSHRSFGRFQRSIDGRRHEPQVSAHHSVGKRKATINTEVAAHGGQDPHFSAEAFFQGFEVVAKICQFASKSKGCHIRLRAVLVCHSVFCHRETTSCR